MTPKTCGYENFFPNIAEKNGSFLCQTPHET